MAHSESAIGHSRVRDLLELELEMEPATANWDVDQILDVLDVARSTRTVNFASSLMTDRSVQTRYPSLVDKAKVATRRRVLLALHCGLWAQASRYFDAGSHCCMQDCRDATEQRTDALASQRRMGDSDVGTMELHQMAVAVAGTEMAGAVADTVAADQGLEFVRHLHTQDSDVGHAGLHWMADAVADIDAAGRQLDLVRHFRMGHSEVGQAASHQMAGAVAGAVAVAVAVAGSIAAAGVVRRPASHSPAQHRPLRRAQTSSRAPRPYPEPVSKLYLPVFDVHPQRLPTRDPSNSFARAQQLSGSCRPVHRTDRYPYSPLLDCHLWKSNWTRMDCRRTLWREGL